VDMRAIIKPRISIIIRYETKYGPRAKQPNMQKNTDVTIVNIIAVYIK